MVNATDMKKRRSGFALIGVVIIVTIFGLLLATYNPTNAGSNRSKRIETERRMEVITKAMEAYHDREEHYPCPASLTIAQDAATFGDETACTNPVASCPSGVACPNSGGSNYALKGAVPVRALELSDDYMFDGWGHRFLYAADLKKINTASGSTPILRIKSTDGVYMTNPPPFYLGSAGPNGTGAYDKSGNIPEGKSCAGSSNDDQPNCLNATYEFIHNNWVTTGGDKTGASRSFDDIMANGDRNSYYQCPAGVKGCSAWYDASDVDGDGDAANIYSNGDAVQTWVDKSGNGRNAVQATAGNRPSYVSSSINSKPVIRFDGSNDRMVANLYVGNPYSIFIVYKGNSNNGRLLSGDLGTTNWLLSTHNGNQISYYANGWVHNEAGQQSVAYIASAVNDGKTNHFYSNGGLLKSDTTNVSHWGPYLVMGGSYAYADGEQANGDIAEVVAYNRALSADERERVECYLGEKYDIPNPCSCPARVGGCVLWVDSQDLSTILDDDNEDAADPDFDNVVETWEDKSGYDNNLTRYTTHQGPLYQSGGTDSGGNTYISGKVITFAVSPTRGMSGPLSIPNGEPWTVIGMGRLTGAGNSRMFQGVNNNWLLGTYNGKVNAYFYDYAANDITGDTADDSWRIYTGKSSASAARSYFYTNTHLRSEQNLYSNPPDDFGINVGQFSTGPGAFTELSDMQISEAVVYKRQLSTMEQRRVECWLARKYRLSVNSADSKYDNLRTNCAGYY